MRNTSFGSGTLFLVSLMMIACGSRSGLDIGGQTGCEKVPTGDLATGGAASGGIFGGPAGGAGGSAGSSGRATGAGGNGAAGAVGGTGGMLGGNSGSGGCPEGAVACGELLAPSDSDHYEFDIFTVPRTASKAIATATVTWASDWYSPRPDEHTSSFANLVEVPYRGGYSCDFIRDYPQNNYVEFESGMNETNPDAKQTGSITVGPGATIAIAGSDCSFYDDFTFHRLVKWYVRLY